MYTTGGLTSINASVRNTWKFDEDWRLATL